MPGPVLLAAALCALAVAPASAQESASQHGALQRILAGGEPQNPAELRLMQEHVQGLIERAVPATVSLGSATGVIVEGGYVLTAGHVSRRPGREVEMRLHDGRRVEGETLGANHRNDAGMIRITTEGDFPELPLGRSADVERGHWCIMLGHPSGSREGRSAPARLGRVLRARDRSYLITDCTMQAGDSGGPLLDMAGRVIGINSRISSTLTHNMHVPVDAFHSEWEQLVAGEVTEAPPRRGRRRVTPGFELDRDADAARVARVIENSSAAKAGILVGDVILEAGDREIDGRRDFYRSLRRRRPGEKLTLTVRRGEEVLQLEVELERRS